jgi:hypothetical protein
MSYAILYKAQFIKIDESQVLPLLQDGSNNCYETDMRGRSTRRARDWGNTFTHNNTGFITTNTDIINSINTLRNSFVERYPDEYSDNRFGYYAGVAISPNSTRKTTFGKYLSFYNKALKNALTIEQLRGKNITVTLYPHRWKDSDITELGLEIKPDVTFTTTEQMVEKINEYKEYYKGTKINLYLKVYGLR